MQSRYSSSAATHLCVRCVMRRCCDVTCRLQTATVLVPPQLVVNSRPRHPRSKSRDELKAARRRTMPLVFLCLSMCLWAIYTARGRAGVSIYKRPQKSFSRPTIYWQKSVPPGGRPGGTDFYRQIVGRGKLFWRSDPIIRRLFMETAIF